MLAPRPEVALTAPQKALLRVQKIQARSNFLAANLLLLLLVGYTALRFPHKYVRVLGDCGSNWLRSDSMPEDHEVVCCDASRAAPCYAGMDLVPIVTSMKGAWALPLSGVVFNYVGVMLGSHTTIERVRACVRRALLYLGVMAFRTAALYMALGALERHVVAALGWVLGAGDGACWFAELRRGGRCPQAFDHSDHVVLLVSHYLAIPLFEWFALSVETAGQARSLKRTLLGLWLALVAGLAVYLLFFTASFFHSPAENVVGLLVAQLGVMAPLYLVTQDQLMPSVKWLRLRHFVLVPGPDPKQAL